MGFSKSLILNITNKTTESKCIRADNENLKLYQKAHRSCKSILNNYPNSPYEHDALVLMGDIALQENNETKAFKHYLEKTGAGAAYDNVPFHKGQIKIQKTLPTEGYHIWHIEHNRGRDNEGRAFVFSIYLNDVEDGGETEFLHFSKRVKPKKGRIVIWPAAFPYVHRGNPPLSGEKYILTSWLRLR